MTRKLPMIAVHLLVAHYSPVQKLLGKNMIVTTTKGDMDDSLLEKREGSIDNDTETTGWVEYWLDGELVHRSVNMVLKQGVFAQGEAQQI